MSMDGSSNSSMMVMMTPFFHVVGGDYLLFQAWKPTSGGAIAGACVGLFILALFERWVNAVSPVILDHLNQRALRNVPTKAISGTVDSASRRSSSDTTETPSSAAAKNQKALSMRTIPPFLVTVDIPRGILYAIRRFLGFALMLAVMTYHAGYIISIIVGQGLGEIVFGRIPMRTVKHDH